MPQHIFLTNEKAIPIHAGYHSIRNLIGKTIFEDEDKESFSYYVIYVKHETKEEYSFREIGKYTDGKKEEFKEYFANIKAQKKQEESSKVPEKTSDFKEVMKDSETSSKKETVAVSTKENEDNDPASSLSETEKEYEMVSHTSSKLITIEEINKRLEALEKKDDKVAHLTREQKDAITWQISVMIADTCKVNQLKLQNLEEKYEKCVALSNTQQQKITELEDKLDSSRAELSDLRSRHELFASNIDNITKDTSKELKDFIEYQNGINKKYIKEILCGFLRHYYSYSFDDKCESNWEDFEDLPEPRKIKRATALKPEGKKSNDGNESMEKFKSCRKIDSDDDSC